MTQPPQPGSMQPTPADRVLLEAISPFSYDSAHRDRWINEALPVLREYFAALSAALARSEEDRARLNWVEELIRNCPHAEFYFNDDTNDEKPDGFSIEVSGCVPLSVQGKTFREVVDKARATTLSERELWEEKR